MTLRLRLLALLAGLAGLLALGEWALVRRLSADLHEELFRGRRVADREDSPNRIEVGP